ncbi:hypothetical protein IGB42_01890 [Andreprevotia sp. IGB-42]|nr:hypothetical protein IGB42_01890 [Andreprevotia sp. IGB-42]
MNPFGRLNQRKVFDFETALLPEPGWAIYFAFDAGATQHDDGNDESIQLNRFPAPCPAD